MRRGSSSPRARLFISPSSDRPGGAPHRLFLCVFTGRLIRPFVGRDPDVFPEPWARLSSNTPGPSFLGADALRVVSERPSIFSGNVHARVETLAGCAGRPRRRLPQWHMAPISPPLFTGRRAHLAVLPPERAPDLHADRRHWRSWLPRRHRVSIYPKDFEALGRLRADVLVAHEGSASSFLLGSRGERMGFAVIEKSAQQLGAH